MPEKKRYQPAKASEDTREYRGIELPNGLKAILISDPSTDKAGAALDVHVGHLSDPWEVPGLAHFLEHMLFLGTEKYPDENEYTQFLSLHGGFSNAYTDCDHTNFYFDVSPAHLDGALDRFAQFFLKPLFTESATDREMKAVNSENDKNLACDSWRSMQLERSLSKAGHDYGKFGTGNTDTLEKIPKEKGINVREELLKFHDKWYSANIMALAVLGNQSLDELEDLVTTYFEGIVFKESTEVPSWPEHPFADEATLVHLLPIKDLRQLNLSFPIPDCTEHYKSKPVNYVSHLIGHEGKGSLLSELKSLGYVNNLVAGLKPGANGFAFFIVDVDLTETGIENTDHIIMLVFQYLAMLRINGVQEWVHEECKHVNEMMFRFKDKERPANYVRSLANTLHMYPMDEVLTAPILFSQWNPDLIKTILDRLVPHNVYVMIIGQKFEDITTESEQWYGTKYKKEIISQDKIQTWSAAVPHERFHIPPANEFIPTEFDQVARDTDHKLGATIPAIIEETSMSRLWYLQDTEFLLPKCCVSLEIFSPLAYVDPHHTNLTSLFVTTFKDALTEYSYDAEMAGLWYSLTGSKYGLALDIRGYHQKQDVLLDKIMSNMKSFQVDEARFEVLKEAFIRAMKNFEMEQPHSHANYRANVLTTEKIWTKEQLLKAAMEEKLTATALQEFIPHLLGRMRIEMFVHGNVTPGHALNLLNIVENRLKPLPLPINSILRCRQTALEPSTASYFEVENAVHSSSCINTQLLVGLDSLALNPRIDLFAQIIKEPFFNTLRTKEQLGYIVYSGVRSVGGVHGLQLIVQSHKKPAFLDSRIESFLVESRDLLKDMDDDEFERHKKALSDKKLEKPKKLSARNERIWREISSQRYNFKRVEIEVEELLKISRQELLDFFDKYISSEAAQRRKLSTHVISTVPNEEDKTDEKPVEPTKHMGQKITDVTEFKGRLSLYPLAQPYVALQDIRRNVKP